MHHPTSKIKELQQSQKQNVLNRVRDGTKGEGRSDSVMEKHQEKEHWIAVENKLNREKTWINEGTKEKEDKEKNKTVTQNTLTQKHISS